MARGVVSILLLLPLVAALLLLAAAGASATTAVVPDDDMGAIRLPTDIRGVANFVAAHGGDEEDRPWGDCCDLAMCTRSWPPICRCLDKVERCAGACKKCEELEGSRHSCAEWYKGEPGPQCHKDAAISSHGGFAAGDEEEKGDDGDEKRPWKCCSLPICTKSWPPVCHCWDEVKRCSSACSRCEEVEGSAAGHRRYRCLDTHRGDPGPRCREQEPTPTVASRYRF